MTVTALPRLPEPLDFELSPDLEAHQPPESEPGRTRDAVRMLVSPGEAEPVHSWFRDLPRFLEPGDLLVINTSGTLAAALDGVLADRRPVAVHLSNHLGGDQWVAELRRPVEGTTVPFDEDVAGAEICLPGRAVLVPHEHLDGSTRLWKTTLIAPAPVAAYLATHGRPIQYSYVPDEWPIDAYQTVFATEPGSAEMPSAARPFTPELVTRLVSQGVRFAPITLHTGVASLERHERPSPELRRVPEDTADLIELTRRRDHRVIAVGTTVVRALESSLDDRGNVVATRGWTELVVTPDQPVRSVDGLISGWHEPEATHLAMLEAVTGRRLLEIAYAAAVERGYRWHEFGDLHLMLPDRR